MSAIRIIERKSAGQTLEAGELQAFLGAYLEGDVPDYQMAAFLMAVWFRGLSGAELDAVLHTMIASGASLDLSHLDGPRVDKHSTGGVGDKVSLVLAPLAAELGLYVPMMSGRGLGHTGGTLDKLESIPGFRTDIALDEFVSILERERFAMIGQTPEIAPLDRRLYDLRSVTGTVSSIPLIATSIMSKKLAEGLTGLVLDVKAGSGAFLPGIERALELARTMVTLGERAGVETVALVTAMDRPLGRAIGNALEVAEALDCLAGGGPADLREVTLGLVAQMMVVGGLEHDAGNARGRAAAALDSGRPLERFARVVALQGGDTRAVHRPERLPAARVRRYVRAQSSGFAAAVDPRTLGHGVVELGGGRTRLGATINRGVGFRLEVQVGEKVASGSTLGVVYAATSEDADRASEMLRRAIRVAPDVPPPQTPLMSHRVTATGVEQL